MKKLALFLLTFLSACFLQAQTPTDKQGYAPKVFSLGNLFNQLRADSAQHIPHKYAQVLNTTDTTPQIFAWSTSGGDSLVLFVNGRYIIIGVGSGSGADSTSANAFYTKYRSDTSRTNIYNAIGLKRDITDTSFAHFLMTRPGVYKVNDSMKIVNDARYVQNAAGVNFLGRGTYAARPVGQGNGVWWATDSAGYFLTVDNGTTYTRQTDKPGLTFNLYTKKDGGRGIMLLRAADSSLYSKGLLDSIDLHCLLNADSTVTCYVQGHDTISANALQTKYRSDTARANFYNGLGNKGSRVMTDPTTGLLVTQAEVLHSPVRLATTSALPSNTYSNGTAGVGATLTATANAALSVDGVAVAVSDRILVKNEAAQANNGLYTVTQTGSGGTPYILTRGNYSSIPANMAAGSHVFVQAGSANANNIFFQQTTGTITFGTTALVYANSASSGGGTPGGSNKQVQINNTGAFGTVPNFAADPISHVVSMDTVTALKGTFGSGRGPVGTIISDKFNRLTLGTIYTQTLPTASVMLDGTKMHITGGVGNTTNSLAYGYTIASEQWSYSVSGKMDSVTSTSYGIILGVQGTAHGINAIFQMSTGTGQVLLESTLGTALATSAGAVSLNQGDSFYITLARSHDSITATFVDPTSATTATVLFKYSYAAGASSDIVQTGTPRLYLYGGPQDISLLTITENVQHNIPVVVLGNSISQGVNAGAITSRWANVLFGSNYTKFAMLAGPSNLVQDIRNAEPEIAAIAPKIALVSIGTNDFGAGTTVPNFTILYASLADELISMNIRPIFLLITPRNAGDVRPYDTAIMNIANIRGLQYIDIYTPLKASGGSGLNPTYDPGDGLHFNSAGHALVASTTLAAAPWLLTVDSAFSFMANQQKAYFNTGTSFGDKVSLGSQATVNNNLPLDDSSKFAINSAYLKWFLKNGNSFINNGTSNQTANFSILGKGTALQLSAQSATTLSAANPTFFSCSPVLTPIANNQTSNAILISPNFLDGGFTGINHFALNITAGDVAFPNGMQFNMASGSQSRILLTLPTVFQNNYSGTTGSLHEFKNQSAAGLTGDVMKIDAVATAGTGGSMLHITGTSNIEVAKFLATGNVLIGTATDNNALFQIAANTTTNASLYLNGAAADVTTPTQGMLRYITTGTHHLYFRDNGSDVDLLTAGGGSPPFSDATAIAKNSSDPTKLAKLDLSGLTTATTRTYSLPDFNGIFAMTNHAQTWTGSQDFTGSTLTVTTQSVGDNSTKAASTAYADAAKGLVAGADLTAQTSAIGTVVTYTPVTTGTFRIGTYLDATANSGYSIVISIAWFDENGTSRSYTMIAGTTSATGFTPGNEIEIRAGTGGAISMSVSLVGAGSATYDVGGTIQKLR